MAPTNFKTYESQARLLAAVIASAPDLKLNFKGIVCLFIRSNYEQNLYLLHTFTSPHTPQYIISLISPFSNVNYHSHCGSLWL